MSNTDTDFIILFTLIKFRNLYRVFKSFLSEISTAATVPTHSVEETIKVSKDAVFVQNIFGIYSDDSDVKNHAKF
jgi:hypothetical protein